MSQRLRTALSLLVAVALVAALLAWSGSDPADVWRTTRSLAPESLLASSVLLALIYLARACRLWVLFPGTPRPPLRTLVPISAAHSLFTYVLPAKTGEASLVVYLKRRLGVPAAQGLALLLVARVLDLTVVAGSLGLTCLALAAGGGFPALGWLRGLGVALLLLAAALALATVHAHRVLAALARFSARLGWGGSRLGGRAVDFTGRLSAAMRAVGGGRFRAGLLASAPIWLGVFLYYAVLARALGLSQLGFAEAVFGSSLAVLANLLPVNGFAGFGTQDVGWVAGFTALGAERELATQSALAFHLVYLAGIVAFGLAAHLWLARRATDPARGPRARPLDFDPR